MIFKRLFNWLKLKSISPQTLYRNRLFIERNSKTRRVMSNFGLTFRNSKWSDYTLNNVSLQSIERAIRLTKYAFMSLIFFSIILTTDLGSYINMEFIGSYTLKESVWLWYDYTTLTIVLMLTSYRTLFANLAYYVYNLLVLKLFTTTKEGNLIDYPTSSSETFSLPSKRNRIPEVVLPVQLQHLLITTALSATTTTTPLQRDVILALYRDSASNSLHLKTLSFYKNLYLTTDYIMRSKLGLNAHRLGDSLNTITNLWQLLLVNDFKNYSPLILNYLSHKTLNVLSNPGSVKCVGVPSFESWDISTLETELGKSNGAKVWPRGTFYYSSLETNKLNKLLSNPQNYTVWNSAITQQINFFKWMRWLYRYSVLHRNVINYSHKITNVKKLLSSGFVSSNLTQNNLWASNLMSTSRGRDTFVNTWTLLYGHVFNTTNPNLTLNTLNLHSLSTTSLTNLKFYEQSYFFYLHRFDMFSTLPKLAISSNLVPHGLNSRPMMQGRSQQTLSLSSSFNLRSYNLLNKNFLSYSLAGITKTNPLNLQALNNFKASHCEKVLLETNKSFLTDSSSIDTLLNFTEVTKSTYSTNPYFTHLINSTAKDQNPLRTYSSRRTRFMQRRHKQNPLWTWGLKHKVGSKQVVYTFPYTDALFTQDLMLRTHILTTLQSLKK